MSVFLYSFSLILFHSFGANAFFSKYDKIIIMKNIDFRGIIMNNKLKISFFLLLFAGIMFTSTNYNVVSSVTTAVQKQVAEKTYMQVSPLSIVANPEKYLHKNVTFNAEFVSFSSLGLDYEPAKRESTKYIGILIKRDDVKDHVIPLSEMKIFIDRELAEKHADLETGDKIVISGNVFSTAIGDPWLDVKELTVTTKKEKETK